MFHWQKNLYYLIFLLRAIEIIKTHYQTLSYFFEILFSYNRTFCSAEICLILDECFLNVPRGRNLNNIRLHQFTKSIPLNRHGQFICKFHQISITFSFHQGKRWLMVKDELFEHGASTFCPLLALLSCSILHNYLMNLL